VIDHPGVTPTGKRDLSQQAKTPEGGIRDKELDRTSKKEMDKTR
jgi:hypothetical protein